MKDRNALDVVHEPLRKLSRMERVEISIGKQGKVWYLNSMHDTWKTVAGIGFLGLLPENVKSSNV